MAKIVSILTVAEKWPTLSKELESTELTNMEGGVLPLLSGFICAFDPVAPGFTPKHTIYTFINLYWFVSCGKDENEQKRGRDWPF